ncbi:MAG: HpcH/HpaI aldolase/citrate lyase family protein, partial [Pseudomonadota bacterium]|nr:HpcH/HpaI aldolase/citrate lyase family protein [Pseudomonadota bacterium]
DTVFVDTRDLDGLRSEALQARRDGFLAKAVIHPSHVDVVNAAFVPGAADIDWARRVLAACAAAPGAGVVTLDGKMIDQPHVVKARQILAVSAQASQAPQPSSLKS